MTNRWTMSMLASLALALGGACSGGSEPVSVYGPGPDPDEPGGPPDGAGSVSGNSYPPDCLDCQEVLVGSTRDDLLLCPGVAEALAYLGDCACRACSVPCADSCLAGDAASFECMNCLQGDCDESFAACLDVAG